MIDILGYLHSVDLRLLMAVNHMRSPFLNVLMKTVSDFELFMPFIACFVLYRLIRGSTAERLMWLGGIFAIVTSDALCAKVLKPLVGRQRPFVDIDGLYVLRGAKWLITTHEIRARLGPSLSWPSCHATNMWAAFAYISNFMPRLGAAVAVLAAVVSYSRVYLGVHYPSDCLGGLMVGLLWGGLMAFLVKRLTRP